MKQIETTNIENLKFAKECFICGEAVELNEIEQERLNFGFSIEPKVCKNCKKAIIYVRKELEKNNE